jgi:hypothetical protein
VTQLLDDILGRLNALPAKEKADVVKDVMQATHNLKWVPNPGPQTLAYESEADILLFGGQPSGGKTELLLGLAFNCHERSLIMRRQYTDLDAIIDSAVRINGSTDGLNRSPPPSFRLGGSKRIDFGAAARPGDEQHWMGRPHDFIGFDEATQFSANQIRFLRGWLRTTTPGQRCRTVLATNPPLSAEGMWVFEMFAPWLNPQHPNPAKPGELRWFVVDEHDKDHEVPGPGQYEIGGKLREAESRTYIPSEVTDNPDIDAKDYQKRLDALPAEIREILMGGFRASFKDQERQVIPTAWVKAAQERWTQKPPYNVPMCAMGVDASGGGNDPMVIAPRYDGWYAPLVRVEGRDIPVERIGKHCAGIVVSHRLHNAKVVVDLGGGYGGPLYEQLIENIGSESVSGYKGAEASTRRTKDQKLGFTNKRSQAIWQFREALDPAQEGGSPIMLPPSNTLLADLTAPTFDVIARGIRVESKEDVCDRLGRSTDEGDAVIMAWYDGARAMTHAGIWTKENARARGGTSTVSYGPRRPNGMRRH